MSGAPIQAVVVAAGASRRMGGIDKLDAVLGGRSVLRWSVEAMATGGASRIVIVAAAERVARVAAEEWLPDSVVAVIAGGERRQESVAAGIAALTEFGVEEASAPSGSAAVDPVILVHDAARPLASPALVRAVAAATEVHGAAIPVLAVAETLKRLDGEQIGETIDRTHVAVAQTPQGVRLSLILSAYEDHPADGPEMWTDEAALLEACRIPVHAVPGEATNLKVTSPADLERAGAILAAGYAQGAAGGSAVPLAVRVGLGVDGHPFGPGEPLVLGGLRIEGAPRLIGHSDGDAALHAVADALLGAAGLGDLGRHFPADSRTPAGIDSRLLLSEVGRRVRAAGWTPVNVDLTIVAARPKLAALLPEMGRAIAEALSIDSGAVNVKASTGNLSGPEGEGRAVSASAVVLVAAAGAAPGDPA